MKIFALTRYFPPEIGTASHLFFELCETLVQQGNQVTVVTGMPWYNLETVEPRYKNKLVLSEMLNDIHVIRIADLPLPFHSWRVKIGHFSTPFSLAFGGLLADKPDIIIFYSPPLLLGLSAYLLAKKWRIPFIMNLQDLYPLCLMDYGYPKPLITFFKMMELFIYRKSKFITVHSEGNKDYLINVKKQPREKVKVIYNWVDTDFITPGPKENKFSIEHNLTDNYIVSFAGTMGAGQGMQFLIDTAKLLKKITHIKFLLVGGGIEKDFLVQKTQKWRLDNVMFLPMQPKEVYPNILRASDICLVTLKKTLSAPTVPSKILSIMAAGKPLIASMPLHGDAPKLINEAQAGICVEAENPEALAQAIMKLYNNPALAKSYGQQGRRYAEAHFSRRACVAKLESLFHQAVD